MASVAVSNSSPLILLGRAGRYDLLDGAFDAVNVPREVASEVGILPAFVQVLDVTNRVLLSNLAGEMGLGEAAAVALAAEHQPCTLVVDDKRGRRAAKRLGLIYVGVIGLVIVAKKSGRIESARDLLFALRSIGMHADDDVIAAALVLAGE